MASLFQSPTLLIYRAVSTVKGVGGGAAATINENISHTTTYNWLLFWIAWGLRVFFVNAQPAVEMNNPCLVCGVQWAFKGSILRVLLYSLCQDCFSTMVRPLLPCACSALAHDIVPKALGNISGCEQFPLNLLGFAQSTFMNPGCIQCHPRPGQIVTSLLH